MQATRWHKCSHGNMMLVYVVLPEFCPEFPLLLCIISGILEYLCNPSCLQLDKPMASSSPVCMSCHCSTLSYFISLSDIERGVQCKIMETKTKEAIKTLSSSMQWYCFVQTALPAWRKWGVLTLKRNRPLPARPGPRGFCSWGCWCSWLGLWKKTAGTFLSYLPPGQTQLPPLWVVFPAMEVLSFCSGVTQEWTELIKCTCLSFEKERVEIDRSKLWRQCIYIKKIKQCTCL